MPFELGIYICAPSTPQQATPAALVHLSGADAATDTTLGARRRAPPQLLLYHLRLSLELAELLCEVEYFGLIPRVDILLARSHLAQLCLGG